MFRSARFDRHRRDTLDQRGAKKRISAQDTKETALKVDISKVGKILLYNHSGRGVRLIGC